MIGSRTTLYMKHGFRFFLSTNVLPQKKMNVELFSAFAICILLELKVSGYTVLLEIKTKSKPSLLRSFGNGLLSIGQF